MTLDDLLPLLPLLVMTGTVVVAMVLIGLRRHYAATATVTIAGLLVTVVVALSMMSWTNQQITPLLIINQFSLFFTVVVAAASLFIAVLSYPYFVTLDDHKEEFYLLLILATLGAIVLVSSNHFVSTLLGLETMSMALYGMVAYPLHSSASAKFPLEASVKYLVLSAAASAFILFGMALIYAETGTLAFVSLEQLESPRTAGLGAGFTTMALLMLSAGVAFKLSLAPFHLWTPDVYEGAPLPATTYLATVGKAAMFVVFMRYVEASGALSFSAVATVFALLAVASILAGNLLALQQDNLKRILAYSSIAHMGYVLVALIAGYFAEGTLSIEAVSFYLLAYIIMSLGAFGVVSVISSSDKEYDAIFDYRGLFWRAPWLAAVFTAMLLSLAGIPLTVGFIGKFYLFFAGVEAGLWWLLLALVIGSGIGLYYYLRLIYRMLLPADETVVFPIAGLESLSAYGVLVILFGLLLLLGVYPAPVMTVIEAAAAML